MKAFKDKRVIEDGKVKKTGTELTNEKNLDANVKLLADWVNSRDDEATLWDKYDKAATASIAKFDEYWTKVLAAGDTFKKY